MRTVTCFRAAARNCSCVHPMEILDENNNGVLGRQLVEEAAGRFEGDLASHLGCQWVTEGARLGWGQLEDEAEAGEVVDRLEAEHFQRGVRQAPSLSMPSF